MYYNYRFTRRVEIQKYILRAQRNDIILVQSGLVVTGQRDANFFDEDIR